MRIWKITPGKGGRPQRWMDKAGGSWRLSLTVQVSWSWKKHWKIITEDLGMQKVCAKFLPRLPNVDHKKLRMQVCQNIVMRLKTDPDLFRRVITGVKRWILGVRPGNQTPEQLVEVSDVTESKAIRVKSQIHVNHVIRWKDHCPLRIIATGTDNWSTSLRSVRKKRRELWPDKSWQLQHDIAPAHNKLSIRSFPTERNITVLQQSLFSPGFVTTVPLLFRLSL